MKNIRTAFALLVALACAFALADAAAAQLGGLGKKVKDVKDVAEAFSIDDEKEIAMGTAAHPDLVAQMGGLSTDKNLNAYVAKVGARLAGQSKRKAVKYQFFVIKNSMVNAFAMPGGFVYVTTGILQTLEDEAELAAVLGHEIAHVEERHGVERMRKAVLAEKGAEYGAKEASGSVGPEVARLVANLFANLALSGYGRAQETESDDMGLAMANTAGYDPHGAVRLFQRLKALEGGEKASGYKNFFASHPPTDKRVQQAEKQIAGLGKKGTETNKAQYDAATKALG
jgi:predicted Zn-dependent protease